ncbi:hypothetical protein VT84_28570 [Gemmata sp. SH-PL17]|nr:hypothetical protein VT84_28570 [Gemmata sp. SH-PL17]
MCGSGQLRGTCPADHVSITRHHTRSIEFVSGEYLGREGPSPECYVSPTANVSNKAVSAALTDACV